MDNPEEITKKKAGRPRIEINENQLLALAQIHCTYKEMAAVIGVHEDTLRDNYSSLIEKGREEGKMSLRRAQFKRALEGNVGMLVWLGKNLLDQKDKIEQVSHEIHHHQLSIDEVKTILVEDKFIDLIPDPMEGFTNDNDT